MALSQEQQKYLQQEGVETGGAVLNFVQALLQKAMMLFNANPLVALGSIVVVAMAMNKQGGIKLGKMFEIKM